MHAVVPACVTVNVCPAIVTAPVRCVVDVFAATVMETLPLAVPLAPLVTVSQLALPVAVHVHPVPAVTATVVDSPAATEERVVGAIEYVHGVVPAWVTVKGRPAIVIVADRDVADVFVAAENATVPLPDPLEPDVTVNHAAGLEAVHAQPDATVTPTEPFDVVAATDALGADNVGVHIGEKENALDTLLTF